ncbi:MAG TPA: peptidylprolyl isomerase [Gammaproteobacteria bacterium]|nr:peptidylprolyl isomerase [Gammaproteobacteria bacterium]
MQISKHAVVTLEYTLTDNSGVVIDQSSGDDAFEFIYGIGGIIPGLETALAGKEADDEISVTIEPGEGYGEREEALVDEVPVDRFDEAEEVKEGMQFQTPAEDGSTRVVTVIKIEDGKVTVDGNHPLAGVILNFDVKVQAVREASEEELEHGHVHGPGGHDH